MVNITYSDGCKNCMKSDGIPKMVTIFDRDFEFFTEFTEYDVANYIRWNIKNLTCPFCGSNALQFEDIEIGDKLYRPENLYSKYTPPTGFVFMMKIVKVDGEILPA